MLELKIGENQRNREGPRETGYASTPHTWLFLVYSNHRAIS